MVGATGARDSSRASRSGGATKITVSLIGDGFGGPEGAESLTAAPRAGGLIDPVTATSGMAPSAVARDSSAGWPRMRRARGQPRQNVVAKGEIGRGRRRPHAEHGHGADHDPEHDGSKPDLFAGMDQRVAILRRRGRRSGSGLARHRTTGGCPSMVMGMVVRVLGIMTGTVRHQHSRAGRRSVPYGLIRGLI